MESESFSENSSDTEVNSVDTNAGLANALSKVLKSANKKHSKSIVLSKAKLHSDEKKSTKKKTHQFEIVPDPNAVKEEEEDDVKPELEDIKPEIKDFKKLRLKVSAW